MGVGGVERGSVRSAQSRLDSHLVAGSQCPSYLLHDSPPPHVSINPRHKAGKPEKMGRGLEDEEGREGNTRNGTYGRRGNKKKQTVTQKALISRSSKEQQADTCLRPRARKCEASESEKRWEISDRSSTAAVLRGSGSHTSSKVDCTCTNPWLSMIRNMSFDDLFDE